MECLNGCGDKSRDGGDVGVTVREELEGFYFGSGRVVKI
jgi:hypothetical protein